MALATEDGALSSPIPHPSGQFHIGADCDYTAAGWSGSTWRFHPDCRHLLGIIIGPITQPYSRTVSERIAQIPGHCLHYRHASKCRPWRSFFDWRFNFSVRAFSIMITLRYIGSGIPKVVVNSALTTKICDRPDWPCPCCPSMGGDRFGSAQLKTRQSWL